MNTWKQKLFCIFFVVFMLAGSTVKAIAQEIRGIVLFIIEVPSPSRENPHRIKTNVFLDTTGDDIEDTTFDLYSTTSADAAILRRLQEGSIVTFDSKSRLGPLNDGFFHLLPRDIQAIDGRPVRSQQN
jgi:hypothetical protein